MRVFPRNTSVIPILRWLKDGGALGALADQDTGVDSLYCDFFGRPAKTPTGPVLLAQVAQARLITSTCWMQADGRYIIEFEGPIPVPPRQDRDPMALWPTSELPMSSSLGRPTALPWALSRVFGYFAKSSSSTGLRAREMALPSGFCEIP